MKIEVKFYLLLFVLMVFLMAYTLILFVFIHIKSPLFTFCSIVSLLFLGVSGIQAILKQENVKYQVNKRRYGTEQEANHELTHGIKLTLRIGLAFAVISLLGLLLPSFT